MTAVLIMPYVFQGCNTVIELQSPQKEEGGEVEVVGWVNRMLDFDTGGRCLLGYRKSI